MKIVCVFMVLAALFGRSKGEVGSCKTVDDIGSIGDPGGVTLSGTDDVCAAEEMKCSRPKIVDGAFATEGVKWGCGECNNPENCVTCETDDCNIDAAMCFNNQANDASVYCSSQVLKCKRPKVDINGGWTGDDNSWGCGECGVEQNCVECENGDNCNTKDTSSLPNHSCLEYKYDNTDNIWVKDEETPNVKCYTEGGSPAGCKMPAPSHDDGNFEVCGNNCPTGAGDEETCRGCDDADNCNNVDSTEDNVVLCKKGVTNTPSNAVANLPSIFCSDGCERPAVAYGDVQGSVEYGCGTCSSKEDCMSCTTDNCNTYPEASNSHQCFTWTWDADTSKFTAGAKTDCQKGDGEAKCNMPKKDAADLQDGDISKEGCGPCADDKTAKCTGTEPGQNVETNHKCFTWSWDDGETKWEPSTAAVDCYTLDTETQCSLPKDRSKKEGFVADGTCAKCGTGAGHENCLTAEDGKNSGRRVLFSLLALAVPIFYALL